MALWNNTDVEGSKPKYLNTTDKAATVGVSVNEAQNAGNIAKGINTPGWVKYTTYTDGNGNTRNKSEVLVAMATITGDNDTLDPDPVITIGTQPQNASVFTTDTATFSVVATVTNGGVLAYQWQIQQEGAGAWANITDATSTSYTTGATATGDGAGATDGDKYRVVVSAGAGATPVTSDAATLTVTNAAITVGTQPSNDTVADGDNAEFVVAATITGSATLSYQWQVSTNAGSTWTPISGKTTATLTVTDADPEYVTANEFRVVVSGTKGATPVTSNSVTLTITA
jgi:hypothetical protein